MAAAAIALHFVLLGEHPVVRESTGVPLGFPVPF